MISINAIARQALLNRARFQTEQCPNSPWVFSHADGRRLQDVKKSFHSDCCRANITNFCIHDLRHTCAAWLVNAGIPLTEARDLLGHASVVMAERYAHLAPENVRAAVAVLERASRSGHATVLLKTEQRRKAAVC
ncbi:MAG: tyrosine-type recombinase/integrase [Streptococcus sp.]|nr:tyrosine-type recombinase/integrase [Streptococcus sp.]